ncbi:MAG: glycerol-3-phosphate dehydrogenase subunit GlpB [Desulfohalobiaceae bacterium]|nr:glycerol-3-phosphate dehydrogenase subunit GlpB [Desulfohalobiaceae bacterium]
MSKERAIDVDVAVIGCGLAGLAAAQRAADRGCRVAIVGASGATDFCSGLFDLLGALPGEESAREDPWRALRDLGERFPDHPLNKPDAEGVARALDSFCSVLASRGVHYTGYRKQNVFLPTQLGTLRPTYRVPATMWPGIEAREKNTPCLVLDMEGMKDFDAEGMLAALGGAWTGARSDSLTLPGYTRGREARPLLLARSLENGRNLGDLARSVRGLLRKGEAVGLPAILGVHDPDGIKRRFQEMVGAPVFEIPTLPNPVPATRIREALHIAFREEEAIRTLIPGRVLQAEAQGEDDFLLQTDREEPEGMIRSSAVVLASGRFLGHGLQGERSGIREPLFRLPVAQPETRSAWHRPDLFDPRGHEIDSAGIETDAWFRPVDGRGRLMYKGLYAAGSLLAHADWMRFKCGAGVCLASAWRAVEGIAATLGLSSGEEGARRK